MSYSRRRYHANGVNVLVLSVIRYIVYFLAAGFLFVAIGTYFSVAAGFGIMALVLLFAPLLLAYASGLALIVPRFSAIVAIISMLPYLWISLLQLIYPSPASEPLFFAVPSVAVVLLSIVALLRIDPSILLSQESFSSKTFIGIFAAIPLLIATYLLITIPLSMWASFGKVH